MIDETVLDTAPEIIRADGVSKRFVLRRDNSLKERLVTLGRAGRRHREDFWALKGINLSITAGTTIGLIGHNGSGKSTLLKVLGGILDPTSGTVSRRGRIAALLELGAGFHPDLTGRENVYLNASILGLSREETEEKFEDIVNFSGIGEFIDTQVKFYSSGMYVRLAFAVAVHTDPDLLLIDEVLAVGDEAFQRKCLDKIRSFQAEGRTIILVTHAMGTVTDMCDRAVLLHHGEVVLDGLPHDAVAAFRDLLEEQRQAEAVQTKAPVYSGTRTLAATVHAEGRPATAPIRLGDRLIVDIDLQSDVEVEDLAVAVQIDNTRGQAVFGTTSRHVGAYVPGFVGQRRVSFAFDDVRFGEGKYFVNVSILDKDDKHLHDVPQACSFTAPHYESSAGVVRYVPHFIDYGAVVTGEATARTA